MLPPPGNAAGTPSPVWPGPDGVARRTSPLTLAAAAVPLAGGLLFFVMSTAGSLAGTSSSASSSSSNGPPTPVFLLGALALVLTGVGQVARWATTTYSVWPTELVVDEGVFTREHRVLPFARVQQADTHQTFVGQVLGLTEVKVDVAGASGSTQIKLRLLDNQTALALRDYVLARRAELHAAETGAPAPGRTEPARAGDPSVSGFGTAMGANETEVLRLGPGRLILGAATHSTVVLGIPAAFAVALWLAAFQIANPANRTTGFAMGGIALLVGVVVILVGAALLAQAVIGQYGFTVSLAGEDIHLRYGLLETRNLTVPRRRVQQVTLVDNPLRRMFGLVELHLHTAAAPGAGQGTTRFTIPIVAGRETDQLLRRLMGDHRWAIPALTPRPAVARRRAIVRRTVLLAAVVVVPAVVLRPAGLVLILLAAAGIPWGAAAHRRAGHGTSATVVALSRGVLHHRIDLVPIDRVQSCRTTRTPMQRWSKLATFLVDTAGASAAPSLWDLEVAVADQLRRDLPRQSAPAPT